MEPDEDGYDPRGHDHLVEPLFAGLRAGPRPEARKARRPPGCGAAAAALALCIALLLTV